MKPNTWYEIEVDDQEMFEQRSDTGGILALTFPAAENVGVLVRESPYLKPRPEPKSETR